MTNLPIVERLEARIMELESSIKLESFVSLGKAYEKKCKGLEVERDAARIWSRRWKEATKLGKSVAEDIQDVADTWETSCLRNLEEFDRARRRLKIAETALIEIRQDLTKDRYDGSLDEPGCAQCAFQALAEMEKLK